MQAAARRRTIAAVAALALGVALLIAPRLGTGRIYRDPGPLPTFAPGTAILLAVGDIGSCNSDADEAVAALAARLPGTIALLGDIAYENGSPRDYATCFDPAWGALLPRIRPAPGNHDYQTADASGYFSYFGAAAGTPGQGWYSYELGTWHVVVLNSNCERGGRMWQGLAAACLAGGRSSCTPGRLHAGLLAPPADLVGPPRVRPSHRSLWRALAAAGADLVLVGHDHDYERIAPVDGIRSFVVGTGGRSLYALTRPPGSAHRAARQRLVRAAEAPAA